MLSKCDHLINQHPKIRDNLNLGLVRKAAIPSHLQIKKKTRQNLIAHVLYRNAIFYSQQTYDMLIHNAKYAEKITTSIHCQQHLIKYPRQAACLELD